MKMSEARALIPQDIEDIFYAALYDMSDVDVTVSMIVDHVMKEKGYAPEIGEAFATLYFGREARDAGIPQAVIDGEARLSDYFSEERIAEECGKAESDDIS